MRRNLIVLGLMLALGGAVLLVLWPGRFGSAPAPSVTAEEEEGSDCSSCTLRHQRLTAPNEQGVQP